MPAASAILIQAFWRLCTFRLAPQDVARSSALLGLTTVLNLSISILINQLQLDLGAAVLVAVIELTVLFGLTATLLFYFRHSARLPQTMTALMGTGAMIGAMVLVLLLLFPRLPLLLRLAVFLWNLLIMAHILRHALNVHMFAGFLFATGYAIVLVQLIVYVDKLLVGGGT
jgi:hypothetical protein